MASTKPSSSDNAKELKKLREKIKLVNRKLRLKVNKAYVDKDGKPSFMHTLGLELAVMVRADNPQITAMTVATVSETRSRGWSMKEMSSKKRNWSLRRRNWSLRKRNLSS